MLIIAPRSWYNAALIKYKCRNTKIASFTFETKCTGQNLLWLSMTNTMALILTLGLAYPYTVHKSIQYTCDNLLIQSEASE